MLALTKDIQATVEGDVVKILPTKTPTPLPDIAATVEARMAATIAAMPKPAHNPTPTALLMSAPASTAMPTLAPTQTLIPSPTRRPTPTPRPTRMRRLESCLNRRGKREFVQVRRLLKTFFQQEARTAVKGVDGPLLTLQDIH